jgi:hypothetical protein
MMRVIVRRALDNRRSVTSIIALYIAHRADVDEDDRMAKELAAELEAMGAQGDL